MYCTRNSCKQSVVIKNHNTPQTDLVTGYYKGCISCVILLYTLLHLTCFPSLLATELERLVVLYLESWQFDAVEGGRVVERELSQIHPVPPREYFNTRPNLKKGRFQFQSLSVNERFILLTPSRHWHFMSYGKLYQDPLVSSGCYSCSYIRKLFCS
jgi:hypothetical protein